MGASTGNPLDALRDIHLPPEPGFWPPAPGWWLLALALVLVAVALAWWWTRAARRRRPRREALAALAALRGALAEGRETPHRVAAECASLLRRVALARFPRRQVAGLTGAAWLEFLRTHGGGPAFASGEARRLVVAPYASRVGVAEAEQIIALCELWIRAPRRAHRGGIAK